MNFSFQNAPSVNLKPEYLFSKKAFLWDFDGCFCNTERTHFLAYKLAFEEFGHDLSEDTYYERFTHLGEGIAGEIKTFGLNLLNSSEIASRKQYHFEKLIQTQPEFNFPEMETILMLCKKLNIQVCIASNSSERDIVSILKRLNQLHYVSFIVGKTENLRKKPHPDIFLEALKLTQLNVQDCLVFEDSQRGLQAANAAGIDAVWIKTPFNEKLKTNALRVGDLSHLQLLQLLS